MANHHITVTGGGPFGRAWFDCICGEALTYASKTAAVDGAMRHHRELIGCTCSRDDSDPACIQQTSPLTTTRSTA